MAARFPVAGLDRQGPQLPFSGVALDRAERLRGDRGWLAERLADRQSRFVLYRDLEVGVWDGSPPALAVVGPHQVAAAAGEDTVLLGIDANGRAWFATALDSSDPMPDLPGAPRFLGLRAAAMTMPAAGVAIAGLGRSLLDWHGRHRFCARCGAPTGPDRGGALRRCLDDRCRAEHFPRTDPVVIMLAISPDGDCCLLGRSSGYPERLASALAGFVEPGESLEEAVRRELREEVGIECAQVRYFGCQPWPFPSTLMIGFFASARSTELVLDRAEIEWARWFSVAEGEALMAGGLAGIVPPQPFTIAWHLLHHWLTQQR